MATPSVVILPSDSRLNPYIELDGKSCFFSLHDNSAFRALEVMGNIMVVKRTTTSRGRLTKDGKHDITSTIFTEVRKENDGRFSLDILRIEGTDFSKRIPVYLVGKPVKRSQMSDEGTIWGNNALRSKGGSSICLLMAAGLSAKRFSDWLSDAQQDTVRYMSRIIVNKTNGQEVVWNEPPKNWPHDSLGKWKNPTSSPKDSIEVLKGKLEYLRKNIPPDRLSISLKRKLEFYDQGNMSSLSSFSNLIEICENVADIHKFILTVPKDEPIISEILRELKSELEKLLPDVPVSGNEPVVREKLLELNSGLEKLPPDVPTLGTKRKNSTSNTTKAKKARVKHSTSETNGKYSNHNIKQLYQQQPFVPIAPKLPAQRYIPHIIQAPSSQQTDKESASITLDSAPENPDKPSTTISSAETLVSELDIQNSICQAGHIHNCSPTTAHIAASTRESLENNGEIHDLDGGPQNFVLLAVHIQDCAPSTHSMPNNSGSSLSSPEPLERNGEIQTPFASSNYTEIGSVFPGFFQVEESTPDLTGQTQSVRSSSVDSADSGIPSSIDVENSTNVETFPEELKFLDKNLKDPDVIKLFDEIDLFRLSADLETTGGYF